MPLQHGKKTGQARLTLAHRGFPTKIGGLGHFLKYRFSLARALSFNTSLELAALILKFAPFYGDYFLVFNNKCIVLRFYPELVLTTYKC